MSNPVVPGYKAIFKARPDTKCVFVFGTCDMKGNGWRMIGPCTEDQKRQLWKKITELGLLQSTSKGVKP